MSACWCACARCLAGDCCQNRWREPRPYIPPQPYQPYIPMVPWPDCQPNVVTRTNITLNYIPLTCEKCGGTSIQTRWHKNDFDNGAHSPSCSFDERNEWPEGEHLHRTCKDCGFHWATAVIGDSK